MKKNWLPYLFCSISLLTACIGFSQTTSVSDIEKNFKNPPASAKPWVFWYWMNGAVSKAGITADIEAMKEVGIGGAYLMPIKDTSSAIPFQPTARQLTPEWWRLVKFAMQEAKRCNLKLAMHVSDGFALAGGPWIKPELSMQKIVWTKEYIKDGDTRKIQLEQPEANENYYKDIAVFAYPANSSNAFSDITLIPAVTTSNGTKANFLSFPGDGKESFKSDTTCWIQYKYPAPFTCRSIKIHVAGNNYQAQRLIIESSDDGKNFKAITRLEPPRHGWQDTDEDYTYAIPAISAQYFRFIYNKEGSEPGAEDLDAAKWKPSFKVVGIYLNDEPVIHQYEAKNGSIWRVASATTSEQVSDQNAIPLKNIINLTNKMDSDGNLDWTAPDGNLPAGKAGWVIVRIGHTSTGHTNATGGAGKGLECDKFNPAAIGLQFNNWFAKAFEKTDVALAKEVLKVFHVDSWECGSQNWGFNFKNEFQKRRGYDLLPYLLVMTGMPVQDAATSEKILHDVRQTIAELVNDIFYKTLHSLAQKKGCSFSAESVAPTMVSDGLLHYKNVDIPMGEFWLNSPTHDKPNDMSDAISGAHIYGKNIIQAEAFTSVRMNWGEYPGNLKGVGDQNFALGINKMVLHVFTHNPWMDKKPGMTLDGIGLYFQRDQIWFKQSKAWIEYLTRCQALLQMGKPVVDIAVFTGEEVPRRSILPDRLVTTLPGIFGKDKVEAERKRLENVGQPLRQIPDGVSHSANMADPEDWIDPLNGYAYDSFNPDALSMATVKDGKIVLPGGASYTVLVIPGKHAMHPNAAVMSETTAKKLVQLVSDGATVIINKDYKEAIGLNEKDANVKSLMDELFKPGKKGKIIESPYTDSSFNKLGLSKDAEITDNEHSVAWTHRKTTNADIYFVSNPRDSITHAQFFFRVKGKMLELWDPVKGKLVLRQSIRLAHGDKTPISITLNPYESYFVVITNDSKGEQFRDDRTMNRRSNEILDTWNIQFDTAYGGPSQPVIVKEGNLLTSWTFSDDPSIKYYSGTAVYTHTLDLDRKYRKNEISLHLQALYNIAAVKVNGVYCGTIWTQPYELDITKALKPGINKIEIEVSNTWANRLIGDQLLPPDKRITWTTAPFRLKDKPLLPAGIIGRVFLEMK
jgi:hypothetical protein